MEWVTLSADVGEKFSDDNEKILAKPARELVSYEAIR